MAGGARPPGPTSNSLPSAMTTQPAATWLEVRRFAPFRAGDRLDVGGPAPAWLKGELAHDAAADVDEIDLAERNSRVSSDSRISAAVVVVISWFLAAGSDLVVFAGATAEGWQADLPRIEVAVREYGGQAPVSTACAGESAVLVTPERTRAPGDAWAGPCSGRRRTGDPDARRERGLLRGDEGLVLKSRCASHLRGGILAWSMFEAHPQRSASRGAAATRTAFTPRLPGPGGVVTAPNGSPLTAVRQAPAWRWPRR
jgi:hypothetical protein